MQENEDQGYGQLSNAEVYAMLSLALLEIKKINKKLDELLQDGDGGFKYIPPPSTTTTSP
jgi:hypothetical protein